MNTLRLKQRLDNGAPTIRPIVDDDDLLDNYENNRGLDPDRLLPPLASWLLPTTTGHRVVIGSCGCGETGFGSLSAVIRRVGDCVVWEPASWVPYENLKRSYSFELVQYLDAVDGAADDRPGEGRGRRVARRVRLLLGMHDHANGAVTMFHRVHLDWISA